jgi:hypothetical protein
MTYYVPTSFALHAQRLPGFDLYDPNDEDVGDGLPVNQPYCILFLRQRSKCALVRIDGEYGQDLSRESIIARLKITSADLSAGPLILTNPNSM